MVTIAEIDVSGLIFNFDNIKKKVFPAKVMAVVKSNAYGHGAVEVAKNLQKRGADYFGIFSINEGLTLRRTGISKPVLMFLPVSGENIVNAIENNLVMTVFSLDSAKEISEISKKLKKRGKVHIKVDTGMGRLGLNYETATMEIEKIVRMPNLDVEGLFMHFATSDNRDKSFANVQLERFNKIVSQLKERNIEIPLKHIANSGAILDIEEAYFDMVRTGIMLYGYYPSTETSESIQLKPVMTLKSKVVQKKKVKKGTSISYNRDYIAKKDTTIVTIPIGYAHGYRRDLSGKSEVLISGKRYPVAGVICMEWIMADISDNEQVCEGDEVVLFGHQGNEYISVLELSKKLRTIPYEILTQVSNSVPRVYINN